MSTIETTRNDIDFMPLYLYPFGIEHMDLQDQVSFIDSIGFKGFSWQGIDETTSVNIDAFYSLSQTIEKKLKIVGIYFFYNLDQQDDLQWKALLPTLGKYKIPLWPVFASNEPNWKELLEAKLIQMCDGAKNYDIDVIIYPHDASFEGSVLISAEEALPFIQKIDRDNLFLSFHLCHELRAGNLNRLKEAMLNVKSYIKLLSISGADTTLYQNRDDWSDAIKSLGSGSYDTREFYEIIEISGYKGSVVLHTYGINEKPETHLSRSLMLWRSYQTKN